MWGRALLALALVAVVLLAAWLLLVPAEQETVARDERPPPPVLAEKVMMETIPYRLQALGTVRANEQTALSSVVTEKIASIYFEDGQTVSKGQLLIQLDDTEELALLKEAQSLLEERERQVERIKQVEGTGALSKSLMDEETSRLTRARAGVDLIKASINDRKIIAPFDGMVGLRNVSPGELITPGNTLAVVSDLSRVKVDFSAPERFIGELVKDQTIEATTVAFPNRVFRGEIISVSPIVDRVTRAVQVRALIPNEDYALRPGMLLEVTVKLGVSDALTLKESALIPQGEKQFVLQVVDGVAERKEVQIGRRLPGKVEILSGLNAGDLVVTEGFRAVPGMPVQVTDPEAVYTVERGNP